MGSKSGEDFRDYVVRASEPRKVCALEGYIGPDNKLVGIDEALRFEDTPGFEEQIGTAILEFIHGNFYSLDKFAFTFERF